METHRQLFNLSIMEDSKSRKRDLDIYVSEVILLFKIENKSFKKKMDEDGQFSISRGELLVQKSIPPFRNQ
jgi:hypothetical protein